MIRRSVKSRQCLDRHSGYTQERADARSAKTRTSGTDRQVSAHPKDGAILQNSVSMRAYALFPCLGSHLPNAPKKQGERKVLSAGLRMPSIPRRMISLFRPTNTGDHSKTGVDTFSLAAPVFEWSRLPDYAPQKRRKKTTLLQPPLLEEPQATQA